MADRDSTGAAAPILSHTTDARRKMAQRACFEVEGLASVAFGILEGGSMSDAEHAALQSMVVRIHQLSGVVFTCGLSDPEPSEIAHAQKVFRGLLAPSGESVEAVQHG